MKKKKRIKNKRREAYVLALLHFLDPKKFKNKGDFVEKYKNLSSFNDIELANLHKELRPHILRRVIKDVEKSLPLKIEHILWVEISPLQKQYYKWILERNFHNLNKGVRGNQLDIVSHPKDGPKVTDGIALAIIQSIHKGLIIEILYRCFHFHLIRYIDILFLVSSFSFMLLCIIFSYPI
ncbi:protein CHROMATIN REMODELING 5-like [Magnolia sinica]|uniref:protein CHROMATIN REMODELING 5-like n=1 Tax=Magnolia sinica TaxID=86752 RepID=UPI00265818AD|nr:protein CHROMATIN REMODELING 5-like [Magnolia sinica]